MRVCLQSSTTVMSRRARPALHLRLLAVRPPPPAHLPSPAHDREVQPETHLIKARTKGSLVPTTARVLPQYLFLLLPSPRRQTKTDTRSLKM